MYVLWTNTKLCESFRFSAKSKLLCVNVTTALCRNELDESLLKDLYSTTFSCRAWKNKLLLDCTRCCQSKRWLGQNTLSHLGDRYMYIKNYFFNRAIKKCCLLLRELFLMEKECVLSKIDFYRNVDQYINMLLFPGFWFFSSHSASWPRFFPRLCFVYVFLNVSRCVVVLLWGRLLNCFLLYRDWCKLLNDRMIIILFDLNKRQLFIYIN